MNTQETSEMPTRYERLEAYLAARRSDHLPFTSKDLVAATGLSKNHIATIMRREKGDPAFMREDNKWHYEKPIEAVLGLGLGEEFIERQASPVQKLSERIRPRGGRS